MMENEDLKRREIDDLLARTRKNVAESRELISQVEARIAETDRILSQQGLTREQVLNMRVTPQQRRMVDEELQRLGLPPLGDDERTDDLDAVTDTTDSSGGRELLLRGIRI